MSVTIAVAGVDYAVPSSAADVNWAAAQVTFEQAVAAQLNTDTGAIASNTAAIAAINAVTWIAPTLLNSWANIGSGVTVAGFYKDSAGTVRLRGGIHTGTSATVAFQLPAGSRPPGSVSLICFASGGVAVVSISTAGNVTITNLTAGTNVASATALDGLEFSTVA